jgi:ribosomal-protein-alanine N-acetyltransferase
VPIEGTLVLLREEREGDAALLASLRNDLDTQAWSKTLPPDYTVPMLRKRFEQREFSYDPREGRFIVEERSTGTAIGYIGYSGLRRRHSVGIGIMFSKRAWGKGYAEEANELLVRFLFEELGVQVVQLWTHSGNPRAIGLAEKVGFTVAARMHNAVYKNGKLLDNVVMDQLREEFYARHPELEDRLGNPFPHSGVTSSPASLPRGDRRTTPPRSAAP